MPRQSAAGTKYDQGNRFGRGNATVGGAVQGAAREDGLAHSGHWRNSVRLAGFRRMRSFEYHRADLHSASTKMMSMNAPCLQIVIGFLDPFAIGIQTLDVPLLLIICCFSCLTDPVAHRLLGRTAGGQQDAEQRC